MYDVLKHMNRALTLWAQRKYKKLAGHKRRVSEWLGKIARREPKLFIHWQMGIFPGAG
jgi:RNA-directed DNA polymerase